MKSELWQRLRETRKKNNMRQQDIAELTGVSRGAVAQWESADPANRTRPSVVQIQAISRKTRVPLDWLLSDESDPGQLWVTPNTTERRAAPAQDPSRLAETFSRAVEFATLQLAPERESGFGVVVGQNGTAYKADYLYGGHVASFALAQPNANALGYLLLLERAAGKALKKHVVVWDRNVATTTTTLLASLGITVAVVASEVAAAAYLISLQ